MQIEILKGKQIEGILEKNYSSEFDLNEYTVFKINGDEIWLASKEFTNLDLNKLKINSIGLYFGRLKVEEKIALSIEGCQLIGRTAKRNIVEIDDENTVRFMEGFDVKIKEKTDCEDDNFVLIKYKNDFVGTGILRQNTVENILPKSRRLFIRMFKQ